MKRRLNKTMRDCLSILLAVCLVLSVCANGLSVLAADVLGEKVNYVALGDSMVNGYALAGYEFEYHDLNGNGVFDFGTESECTIADVGGKCDKAHTVFQWSNGYMQEAPEAYPSLLAKYFGWELTQLATSAMRVEDLRWALEFDYTDSEQIAAATGNWDEARWNSLFSCGDFYTWDNFTNSRWNRVYPGSSTEKVTQEIQTAVAGADVITLGIGNGNFGVFLMNRITEAVGFSGAPEDSMIYKLENAVRGLDEDTQAEFLTMVDTLYARVESSGIVIDDGDDTNTSMMESLMNTVAYTMVSFTINYRGMLNAIITANPDVEIIIVGLMNTMSGVSVDMDGQILNMDELMGIVLDIVNGYMATLPTVLQAGGDYSDATFYYAEAEYVDVIVNSFTPAVVRDPENTIIRERFISEIVGEDGDGMLWEMLKDVVDRMMPGTELVNINRADIVAYENMSDLERAASGTDNPNWAASCALYLAFENAIIEAATPDGDKNVVFDFESILHLGDLSDAFDAVIAAFNESVDQDSDAFMDAATATVANTAVALNAEDIELLVAGGESAVKEKAFAMVAESLGATVAQTKEKYADGQSEVVSAVDAKVEELNSIVAQTNLLCTLLATPNTLSNVLAADENVFGLLNLFARCLIGGGLGTHPSSKGHQTMFEAIKDSYENGYSALYKTISTALQIIDLMDYYQNQPYEYAVEEDSFYLAFGDDVAAASGSYVDKLAAELDVPYENLAASGALIEDAFEIVQSNEDLIKKADLITLGYSNNAAADALLKTLVGMYIAENDWASVVGEENVPMVEQIMEQVRQMLVDQGMGGSFLGVNLSDLLPQAIENYAYVYASNLMNNYKVAKAIHTVNPDAQVVIVGAYNDLDDVVLELGDMQFAAGDYISYLTKILAIGNAAYSAYAENTAFVYVPEVETILDKNTAEGKYDKVNAVGYVMTLVRDASLRTPTDAGHMHIKDLILATMTEPPVGLLGDVNGDGKINTTDAKTVMRYELGMEIPSTLNMAMGDVNGDGKINTTDAKEILRYELGLITEFSAQT